MKVKKKLLLSIFSLILSITVFSSVVFAWFTINDVTGDFVLTTGNLQGSVTLEYLSNYSDSTYGTKETIVNEKEFDKVIENIIPGEVVTFKITVTNDTKSTIGAVYNLKFGEFKYCDSFKSTSESSFTTVTNDRIDETHLFSAIKVYVSDKQDKLVSDKTIHDMKVYQDVTFAPVAKCQPLKNFNSAESKTFIEETTPLASGQSDVYVLKFYFDPTVVKDNGPTGTNSNHLMKQAFHVLSIIADISQEKTVIEK